MWLSCVFGSPITKIYEVRWYVEIKFSVGWAYFLHIVHDAILGQNKWGALNIANSKRYYQTRRKFDYYTLTPKYLTLYNSI